MSMANRRPHIDKDWMLPDQLELVNDTTRVWILKEFKCQSGYSVPIQGGRAMTRLLPGQAVPEGARFESNAWDHEHCELCFKKIMEEGGDFKEGYTDEVEWLCPDCYNQYIAPGWATND
jgi:hypothetical protein